MPREARWDAVHGSSRRAGKATGKSAGPQEGDRGSRHGGDSGTRAVAKRTQREGSVYQLRPVTEHRRRAGGHSGTARHSVAVSGRQGRGWTQN